MKMDQMHQPIDAAVVDPSKELRFIAEVVENFHKARDPERFAMAQDFVIKRLEQLANHLDSSGR